LWEKDIPMLRRGSIRTVLSSSSLLTFPKGTKANHILSLKAQDAKDSSNLPGKLTHSLDDFMLYQSLFSFYDILD
jgi:hypothetical protein